MAKYISEQQITGELGVNQFEHYCLKHKPWILFREELKHDYGIDGEVEIAEIGSDSKVKASGEIIKVQIKSTLRGSYIHKETESSFEFHATNEDVGYWNRHNLSVILIVFDANEEILYAKKIDQIDAATKKTKTPIFFDKSENKLEIGESDFRERFSTQFKSRVDYSRTEKLTFNLLRFTKLPRYLFEYKSNYTDPKDIFDIVSGDQVPTFKLLGDRIYSILDVGMYRKFKEEIVDYNSKTLNSFRKSILDDATYGICAELINRQFTDAIRRERIAYNRQYRRYYFMPLHDDFDEKLGKYKERIISYTPKKRSTATRTVVIFKTYGKKSFYRHSAFETKLTVIKDQLYMILTPQYLFTHDGKEPLPDPDDITKFTNYITAREYNEQNLNHVHFIYSFLSGRDGKIQLCGIKDSELEIGRYVTVESEFSIPLDYIAPKTVVNSTQIGLFDELD